MTKNLKPKHILLIIILFASLSRLVGIESPNNYIFDEVYHAFTAKEFLANHKEAWQFFSSPPAGVAYEWTHPPLAKEIMAISMFIFRTTDAFAYRLPGLLLGILSIYLVYSIGQLIFKDKVPALISAFIFSIEGLNFVQSRTGMNDIYFVAFMLTSLLFFLKKKPFFSALFWGLSLSSKWTALYLLPVFVILIIINRRFRQIPYFFIIPPIIYFLSYLPFFLLGHDLIQFKELQQQMWWYHTGLKASHDYASAWWSWPLNLYPVWYYVNYVGEKIGNTFATGNPIVFWLGFGAMALTLWEFLKSFNLQAKREVTSILSFLRRQESILIILLGYFAFFLPWAFSPRIMFLYHYSPAVPFLTLALGYQLSTLYKRSLKTSPKDELSGSAYKQNKKLLYFILMLMLIGFILIYPFITAIPLPKNIMELFFFTNLTKNPFG